MGRKPNRNISAAPVVKKRLGGPRFKDFDPDEVFKLASEGLTQCEIAYALGSCPDTWFARIKDEIELDGKSELAESFKLGKGHHAKMILGGLSKLAGNGNLGALIFLAKAHLGRRDVATITLPPEGDHDISPKYAHHSLTPEQRRERILELESKRIEAQFEKDESE